MNEINAASGKLIAEAIDKRITSVAKQLFNNSERDKTVYGVITKTNQGYFSVKVNNQIYNNVVSLRNAGNISVGEKVTCLVPNGNYSDMIILGVADGTIQSGGGSGGEVYDGQLTIQRNGITIGTFTANSQVDKLINILVPTTAQEVGALPNSTLYTVALSFSYNSNDYSLTVQLKDQNGDNIGSAGSVTLPLSNMVIDGSYDSNTKSLVLEQLDGTTESISLVGLISGLQPEITSTNKLSADLVDDSNTTNKFVTSGDISNWNSKQDALNSAQLSAVNSGIDSVKVAQIGINQSNISTINGKIPSQASSTNQLADKDFVNSSINALAAFYITRDAQGDNFNTYSQLSNATTFYSGGQARIPTQNDYTYVRWDESKGTQVSGYSSFTTTDQYIGYYVIYNNEGVEVTSSNKDSVGITAGSTIAYENLPTTRYSYQGGTYPNGQWEFQLIVNNSALTSAQMAALNSGITSTLVGQITTNQTNIGNKMDKVNPVGSGSISLNRAANSTVGNYSSTFGANNTASSSSSFAEGQNTTSSGFASHSEGWRTVASNSQSHSEGFGTTASGEQSHAEGSGTIASGTASHAEGFRQQGIGQGATGDYSHSEGYETTASGNSSHSEGSLTTASGNFSHASGLNTISNSKSQFVFGEYNSADSAGQSTARGTYVEIVGNGSDANTRSNARTLDWSGNEVLSGTSQATGFKTPSGTSSQFLKADGSTDSTSYQPTLTAGTNISIDSNNVISATVPPAITVDSALSTTSENPVQNKVITSALNGKYTKPSTGIPESDLASSVQTSLSNANNAVRYDTASQGLTSTQQGNARGNISALGYSEAESATIEQTFLDNYYNKVQTENLINAKKVSFSRFVRWEQSNQAASGTQTCSFSNVSGGTSGDLASNEFISSVTVQTFGNAYSNGALAFMTSLVVASDHLEVGWARSNNDNTNNIRIFAIINKLD